MHLLLLTKGHCTLGGEAKRTLLVLDGHESHESAAFQEYCKQTILLLLVYQLIRLI